jgi:hypothetical protein
MNFTYKNPKLYDKKYAILKQLEMEEKIKKSNEKAMIYSLSKKEYIKIQDVETNLAESKIVNDNIVTSNTGLTIDIDTNIAKKFEMVENINENEFYNFEELIVPYNVQRIRNKGVKIMHNVYQSKYSKGEINGTGLGDFIRGSYFLLEFCDKYQFEPRIIFNNCISKFLMPVKYNFNLKQIQPLLEKIDMFHSNNFKEYNITEDNTILEPNLDVINIMADFVEYIMKEPVYNGHSFIYCIPYPLLNVSAKNKAYMRAILEPINEIKCIVNQTLHKVGLHFKNYIVFHVRSGDAYLNKDNKIFYQKYLDKIKIEVAKYMVINGCNNYLLIADNNEIKIFLNKELPQLKIILNEITHFGEGVILEEEKVKNTLVDFYILSFANKIISFSAYKHGSGFSFWCAKTFDIPYISKYICN